MNFRMSGVCAVLIFVSAMIGIATAGGILDDLTDTLADTAKEGFEAATGAEVCDSGHMLKGIFACPMPGMPSSNDKCCTRIFSDVPACCTWFGKNLQWFIIGGGVGAFLLILACCVCCCCACGGSKSGGVVIVRPMMQPQTIG